MVATSSTVTLDEGPLRQPVSPLDTNGCLIQHLWRLRHPMAYFDYNLHAVITVVFTTIDGWGTSGYSWCSGPYIPPHLLLPGRGEPPTTRPKVEFLQRDRCCDSIHSLSAPNPLLCGRLVFKTNQKHVNCYSFSKAAWNKSSICTVSVCLLYKCFRLHIHIAVLVINWKYKLNHMTNTIK